MMKPINRLVYISVLLQFISGRKNAVHAGSSLMSCSATNPLNTSKDICGDLCEKGAVCAESGACVCSKEPGASMLGGQFTHCTNWDYVEQKECIEKCKAAGKNDHRVCWTVTIGNYCTCFDKIIQPTMPV